MTMGRPLGRADSYPRPPRAKPENLQRDWLIVRRRKDGAKLREIAAEFSLSIAFVHQILERVNYETFTWRSRPTCPECGQGVRA
jgi:hypothetical protein